MLVQFSVANYLSFKERQTLSMVASRDKTLEGNTFLVEEGGGLSLLKSAALYGANASGKSNVVKALKFMRKFVLESAGGQRGDPIPVVPFKLARETVDQPSEFEVVFMVDEDRYVYGFIADHERVHEEWLTLARGSGKPGRVFTRDDSGAVRRGVHWNGELKRLVDLTRPNALFLSVAVQFNSAAVRTAFDWFAKRLRTISDRPEAESEIRYSSVMLSDATLAAAVTDLARAADLGIDDFSVEQVPLVQTQPFASMTESTRNALLASVPAAEPDKVMASVVRAVHTRSDGERVAFQLDEEESAGTVRLFALAGPWLHVVHLGTVLLVDELDSKLHPLLTRLLVKMVHSAQSNPQLVFTTHDCGLLDSKLLRRDQVWFTEKDRHGATQLYSLWDFKVRSDQNLQNGYLTGRFGAIPFIGEFGFGQEE
jgi:predicted ATPase